MRQEHDEFLEYYRESLRRKRRKPLLVPLLLALILMVAVGGTIAYLIANGGQVTNFFSPAEVTCSVDADGKITNTGDVDAYIRAAVVVNWMDENGSIYAVAPSYTLQVSNDWTQKGDYYYYIGSGDPTVMPEQVISAPVTVTVTGENPDAAVYTAVIEVVAEAIQAAGNAYQHAWGIDSLN